MTRSRIRETTISALKIHTVPHSRRRHVGSIPNDKRVDLNSMPLHRMVVIGKYPIYLTECSFVSLLSYKSLRYRGVFQIRFDVVSIRT